MAIPRSRFPAYPPTIDAQLQLFLEAIRKELEKVGVQGGASIIVEEGDVVVSSAANVLDFVGTDFDLTHSPIGEVNVAINANLARLSSDNTWTGTNTFQQQVTALSARLGVTDAFVTLERGGVNVFNYTGDDGDSLTIMAGGATGGPTGEFIDLGIGGTALLRIGAALAGKVAVTDSGAVSMGALAATTGLFTGTVTTENGIYLREGATLRGGVFPTSTVNRIRWINASSVDILYLESGLGLFPATAGALTLGTVALPWSAFFTNSYISVNEVGYIRSSSGVLELQSGTTGIDFKDSGYTITRARLTDGGNFLLGTTTPATGNPRLDVVATHPTFVGADGTTNVTRKVGGLAVRHYTNAEEPLAVISGDADSASNNVNIGGGHSGANAATAIQFYTAATTTTLTGTLAADLTGVGTGSLWDFRGDIKIGSLGRFDSADTPTDMQLLRYNESIGKWQAESIEFVIGTNDFHARILGDGTGAAYVHQALSPADGAVNTPGTPVVKTGHNSFVLAVPGSYVKTANFKQFRWEYCTGASCTTWVFLTNSTSLQIVHSRLDALSPATIVRYQVRAESATTVSAFAATGDNTITAGSDTEAFGGIIAGNIAAIDMAAMTGDFGIMRVGQMRDVFVSPTSVINFGGKGGVPSTARRFINFEDTALPAWTDGQGRVYVNLFNGGSAGDLFLRHDKFVLSFTGTNAVWIGTGYSASATALVVINEDRSAANIADTKAVITGKSKSGGSAFIGNDLSARGNVDVNAQANAGYFNALQVGFFHTDTTRTVTITSGGAGGGTLTHYASLHIENPVIGTGTPAVTNYYGIKINDILGSIGTTNYAIYTGNPGLIRFGDNVIPGADSTVTLGTTTAGQRFKALHLFDTDATLSIERNSAGWYYINTKEAGDNLVVRAHNDLNIGAGNIDRMIVQAGGAVYINSSLRLGADESGLLFRAKGTPATDGALKTIGEFGNNADAYSVPPKAGIIFSTKYNSGGAMAGGGGIQTVKTNATDGNLDFALELLSRLNGSDPAVGFRLEPNRVIHGINQPRCRATNSVGASLTSGTLTTLAWNTEDFDTNGMHDTATNDSRITVPTNGAGVYWIAADVRFGGTGITSVEVRITKNGNDATVIARQYGAVPSQGDYQLQAVGIDEAVAGDYYQVRVSVVATSPTFNQSTSWFSGAKLW